MADKNEQQAFSEEEALIPEIPFNLEIASGKTQPVPFPEDDLDLVIATATLKREGEGEVILELTTKFLPENDGEELEEETITICKFEKDEEDINLICTSDMDPHFTVKGPGTVTLKGVYTIVISEEEEEEFPEEEDEKDDKKE